MTPVDTINAFRREFSKSLSDAIYERYGVDTGLQIIETNRKHLLVDNTKRILDPYTGLEVK